MMRATFGLKAATTFVENDSLFTWTAFVGENHSVISNRFLPFMRRVISSNRWPNHSRLCVVVFFLALAGCGGAGSGSQAPPPPPSRVNSVIVTPGSIAVLTGASELFTAQVMGTGVFSTSVTWSVNGVSGGNSSFGTIVGGQYTAPAALPTPNGVTITATSVQDSALFGTSTPILYCAWHRERAYS
jgi:hypothetical protein